MSVLPTSSLCGQVFYLFLFYLSPDLCSTYFRSSYFHSTYVCSIYVRSTYFRISENDRDVLPNSVLAKSASPFGHCARCMYRVNGNYRVKGNNMGSVIKCKKHIKARFNTTRVEIPRCISMQCFCYMYSFVLFVVEETCMYCTVVS
jgi:hypothetical protein